MRLKTFFQKIHFNTLIALTICDLTYALKLGFNETFLGQMKLVIFVHKLTRLNRTKMAGPAQFVITELDYNNINTAFNRSIVLKMER